MTIEKTDYTKEPLLSEYYDCTFKGCDFHDLLYRFAKSIGMNTSPIRKYKMGLASASGKQKQIIQ